jgi:hypothetical protein
MTAAIFGETASTANAAARQATRIARKKDAAYARRQRAHNDQLAALHAATTTWSLRDLFAARKRT